MWIKPILLNIYATKHSSPFTIVAGLGVTTCGYQLPVKDGASQRRGFSKTGLLTCLSEIQNILLSMNSV